MTLVELYNKTKEYKAWRGLGYGQNQQWTLKNVVPFKGTKTLLIQAQCFGQTVNGIHTVNFQFENLKYVDEIPENAEYKTYTYKDEDYYFEYPDISTTKVRVRCSCPDFYWRFALADNKANCLFGSKPKAYKKKTNRKPLNPDMIPGICKHIVQLQSFLKTKDIDLLH